jgi:hypothetical protein
LKTFHVMVSAEDRALDCAVSFVVRLKQLTVC